MRGTRQAAGRLRLALLSVHSSPLGNIGAKDTGGMSIYVREVAREMGQRGVLVDIYTRVHHPNYTEMVELGENVRLIHLRAGEGEIDKLAVYPHLPTFAGNLENFRKQNNLQYDLVFSHYWLSGWVGNWLRRWWSVPHLVMFHTIGAVKNALGIGEAEPALRIEAERELAGNGHYLIAATKKEKEDLVRYYGASAQKVSVIPCGVNLERFHPRDRKLARQHLGFGDNEGIILFVGRIEPLKGIDQLIRAMTYLPGGRKARLVIIGGDEHSRDEVERLRRLSQEWAIADSVSFLGAIRHEELPQFYCAADVCVVPSYYESFGLVALESLACGTPVVATDVGNLRNIIRAGKTGYVVANNEPRRLAEKLSSVLARAADEKTAALIRASVTRFSWSNVARVLLAECRRVLAS